MPDEPERRELHFESVDELLAEAESLASGDVETTGSFSFGQILEHLARTLDVVTGHTEGARVPLPMRLMGRMVRPLLLSRPMSPGFKLPKNAQSVFWPSDDVDTAEALAHLKESLERYKTTEPLPKHPFFGKMNREQSDKLQCRHGELHLSFVRPK